MKAKSKNSGLNEKARARAIREKLFGTVKSSSLNENSIQPAIAELEKLYEAMAFYFREDTSLRATELIENPQPRIVIQSRGRKRSLGWFAAKRWQDRKDETIEPIHEITLCAESLSQPLTSIAAILIHEMVHLYCYYAGIKDVGKDGRYHNQKFRDVCFAVGLLVEKDERIGWARTSLGPDLEKRVFSLNVNDDAFSIFRIALPERDKTPTKMKKWQCECTIVRCATELTATCQKCGYTFANVDRGEIPRLASVPLQPPQLPVQDIMREVDNAFTLAALMTQVPSVTTPQREDLSAIADYLENALELLGVKREDEIAEPLVTMAHAIPV